MTNEVTTPTMTARRIQDTSGWNPSGLTLYVADGPDGHTWLLKRTTEADALRDGLAYFMATRKLDASGRWVTA